MKEVIQVRMGEVKIMDKAGFLGCTGLGSCIGLALYDASRSIAGLAHIMLPNGNGKIMPREKLGKYADQAVPWLFEELKKSGASPRRIRAKMAGGAQMFSFDSDNDLTRIGDRNSRAVNELLESLRIPLISSHVGGTQGRTIEFNVITGELSVRSVKGERIVI